MKTRTLVSYESARLEDLDANTGVVLPAGWDGEERIYAVPGFLIIGAQRSGTSALSRWLSVHPNLQTIPLEYNFFSEVVDLERDWPRYVINPHFYLRSPAQVYATFEKTPDYLDKRNHHGVSAAAQIQRLMPSGRFIVLLRRPTERAYSLYKMRVRQHATPHQYSRITDPQLRRIEQWLSTGGRVTSRPEGLPSFHEMVTAMLAELDAPLERSRFTLEQRRMLTLGHYATHLEEWLRHFPREQLLVLFYEDFRDRPFDTMDTVLAFLEVPHIDYRTICEKTGSRWELMGIGEPPSKPRFEVSTPPWVRDLQRPIGPKAAALLDAYFRPWNERLAALLPGCEIPWSDASTGE
ncbi:MAG: sulfotransferase [Myxococcota bacterium]